MIQSQNNNILGNGGRADITEKWFSNIANEMESQGNDKETAASDMPCEKILRTTWLFGHIGKKQTVLSKNEKKQETTGKS